MHPEDKYEKRWQEVGKRLGRGLQEVGKRLGRGWEEVEKTEVVVKEIKKQLRIG